MKKNFLFYLLFIVVLSFGQTTNKKKQVAKNDHVLKQVDTQVKPIKSKEELWKDFWPIFKTAIEQKNKQLLIALATKDETFGVDTKVETMLQSWGAEANNPYWKEPIDEVRRGTKPYKNGGKITKGNILFFVFRNNKWFWGGYLEDTD